MSDHSIPAANIMVSTARQDDVPVGDSLVVTIEHLGAHNSFTLRRDLIPFLIDALLEHRDILENGAPEGVATRGDWARHTSALRLRFAEEPV